MLWEGRWEGGSCLGTHVRIKDFKIKKIKENNRMGKTSDLFKKIRDTKGKFHAKVGSIKDRNGMDLFQGKGNQI